MRKLTTVEFITKAKLKHGDTYDYSRVNYANNITAVIIICSTHGDFLQKPMDHLSGCGCPICGRIQATLAVRSNANEFIEKSNLVHNNKYNYSKVVYVDNATKVIIICNMHGEFLQTPNSHLFGHECKSCWNIRRQQLSLDMWGHKCFLQSEVGINKIKQLSIDRHGVEFPWQKHMVDIIHNLNDYNYMYDSYIAQNNTASSLSDIMNISIPTVLRYLKIHKLPIRQYMRYSQICIQWIENIAVNDNTFIQHARNIGEYTIPGTKYRVDGFDIESNTVYEFHGDCFHGNPKLYISDTICNPFSDLTAGELYQKTIDREQKIRDLGYNLVVMWESDYRKQKLDIKQQSTYN